MSDGNSMSDGNGQQEICNGIDDDGDGLVDEDCPCVPFDVSFPTRAEATNWVWTGTSYLVLVASNLPNYHPDENVIQIVGSDGQLGSTFAAVPGGDSSLWLPRSLAWNGAILGVLVTTISGDVNLLRFDAAGTQLGSTLIATGVQDPRLAWAGDRFVVVWRNGTSTGIWCAEVASDGAVTSSKQAVQGVHFQDLDNLAISATRYAVTVENYNQPSIALIDRATLQGSFHQLDLDVAPEYAGVAVWSDEIGTFKAGSWFQRIDASGALSSAVPEPSLSKIVESVLVGTMTGYRVYGLTSVSSTTLDVVSLDLDPRGTAQGASSPVLTIESGDGGAFLVETDASRTAFYTSGGTAMPSVHTQRIVQRCQP